jgi:acetylornithine deacetylase/succinyl-diaminopimelate desuccinylase-like protein
VSRSGAVGYASEYFDSGVFLADLSRRVAFRTESGIAGRRPDLLAYLEQEMVPAAHRLGAIARIVDNPVAGGGPLLIARRDEDAGRLTLLTYGHADVVLAEPQRWRAGLDPWRAALSTITVGGAADDPDIDQDWGEPGLTPAERVIAGNTLEVLSLAAGNPDMPVNAIPGSAHAYCQLRFVPGTDIAGMIPAIRAHLDNNGFRMVSVEPEHVMNASRTDLGHPWVQFVLASLERTEGTRPDLLPNLGGGLPNDVFTDGLGLPAIWIPHSYPACAQHAPDEHLLAPLARQALRLMAGLFWDLGDSVVAGYRR